MNVGKIIEGIKLLFKARQPTQQLVGHIKTSGSNWKTLKFWVTLFSILGGLASVVGGILPATQALIVIVAIAVIYNVLVAFQDATQPGHSATLTSTKFWIGIAGIVSAGLIQLQGGGVNPEWVQVGISILAAVMAGAQNVASNNPKELDKAA